MHLSVELMRETWAGERDLGTWEVKMMSYPGRSGSYEKSGTGRSISSFFLDARALILLGCAPLPHVTKVVILSKVPKGKS